MTAPAVWIVSRRPDGIPTMTPAVFIAAEELFADEERERVFVQTAAFRERERLRMQRLRASRRRAA